MQINKSFYTSALLALLAFACTGCADGSSTGADVPQGVYDCAEVYADVLKTEGPAEASQLIYLKNEAERAVYAASTDSVESWKLDAVEPINPDLYALTLSVETREGGAKTAYNYVAKLDGQNRYIVNQKDIPDSLRENFDPEKYQYDSEDILSDNDIILGE